MSAEHTSAEFKTILTTAIKRTGGRKGDFARAIGITPSGLSRLSHRSASVAICLRIAEYGHVNPSRVLRAAGWDDVADLIEGLYGSAAAKRAPQCITATQQRVLTALDKLPKTVAKYFQMLIFTAAEAEQIITDYAQRDRADSKSVAHP